MLLNVHIYLLKDIDWQKLINVALSPVGTTIDLTQEVRVVLPSATKALIKVFAKTSIRYVQ